MTEKEEEELLTEWEKDIKARIINDHTIIMKALTEQKALLEDIKFLLKEIKVRIKVIGEALE